MIGYGPSRPCSLANPSHPLILKSHVNSPGSSKKGSPQDATSLREKAAVNKSQSGDEPGDESTTIPKSKGSVAKRRRNARQKAMQALYQWDFDSQGSSVTEIIDQFCELQNMERVDVEYFKEVFLYVAKNLDTVDGAICDYIDRPMERLDPVERSVLRVACAEFLCRPDTPYKVVVNEALEITKLFGADQGHKFVNGVVDKLAAQLRPVEHKASGNLSSDSL